MLLEGKRGVVLSVTNEHSIGWGIARAAAYHGARVAIGAQNDKLRGRLDKLIERDDRFTAHTVDFAHDDQLERLRDDLESQYGQIDFVVHSAAFANREDLTGRFIDTSREGFRIALETSAYSLVAVCKSLEQILAEDGSVMAMSYLGSSRVVKNYNIMGVAKAALESSARYLAQDLGERGIRVNIVSPGPIQTVAARGVPGLLDMINYVQERAPLKRPFGQDEVGGTCVYLISDLSRGVTGQTIYVDSGYSIAGM